MKLIIDNNLIKKKKRLHKKINYLAFRIMLQRLYTTLLQIENISEKNGKDMTLNEI